MSVDTPPVHAIKAVAGSMDDGVDCEPAVAGSMDCEPAVAGSIPRCDPFLDGVLTATEADESEAATTDADESQQRERGRSRSRSERRERGSDGEEAGSSDDRLARLLVWHPSDGVTLPGHCGPKPLRTYPSFPQRTYEQGHFFAGSPRIDWTSKMLTAESRRIGRRLMDHCSAMYYRNHKIAQGVFLGALTLEQFEQNMVPMTPDMGALRRWSARWDIAEAERRQPVIPQAEVAEVCKWTDRPLSAVADHVSEVVRADHVNKVGAKRRSLNPKVEPDLQPGRVSYGIPHTLSRLCYPDVDSDWDHASLPLIDYRGFDEEWHLGDMIGQVEERAFFLRYDRASCQLVSDKLITLPHVFCSARGDLPQTIPTDMWWVEVDGLRRVVHDRAFRVWQLEHRPVGGGQVKPSGSHEAEIDSSDRVVFRGPRTLLPKAIPTYTEWVPHSWVLSPQQRAISEVSPQQRTHPPQQRAFGKQKRA